MNNNIFEKIYKMAESERMSEMARPTPKDLRKFIRFVYDACDIDILELYANRVEKAGTKERGDDRVFRELNLIYYKTFPVHMANCPTYPLSITKNKGFDNVMFTVGNSRTTKITDLKAIMDRSVYFAVEELDEAGLLNESFSSVISNLESLGYNTSKEDAIEELYEDLDGLRGAAETPEVEKAIKYIIERLREEGDDRALADKSYPDLDMGHDRQDFGGYWHHHKWSTDD